MGRPPKLSLDEILARATELFWLHGCGAVSTRDLEAQLGLRAPAIYRRFSSKHALLARCIDHYVDTIVAGRIERKLERSADPIDGLYDFFASTLAPHGSEPRQRGCLLANTATHSDGQVPDVRAAVHRGLRVTEAAFRRQIERAQATGQVDAGLDADAVAQALVLSLQGLLTLVRAGVPDLKPRIDVTFELLRGRTADREATA